MLNCAQMRDYQYIQFFLKQPIPLDCKISIHEGAAREIQIWREKKDKANAAAAKKVQATASSASKPSLSRNKKPAANRNTNVGTCTPHLNTPVLLPNTLGAA